MSAQLADIDNTRSYDSIADLWDANRRSRGTDPCVKEFCAMLPQGAHVLDVGCGTGYPIASYLASQGCRVTGIDKSPRMIARANAMGLQRADFSCADFLDYAPGCQFDAIIAFDSLWHIPLAAQRGIYPKAASLLKPRGLFLFTHGRTTGSVQGEMFGAQFCYSALDGVLLRDILRQCGLKTLWFFEDYAAPVTGTRDLLALAEKASDAP